MYKEQVTLHPGRYFLALWPPGPVRDGIARLAGDWLRPVAGRCREVRAARYHLTLCFLGDLDRDGVQALKACMPALCAIRGKPLRLLLDCTGHFGHAVAWLGCRHAPRELSTLHQRQCEVLREAGVTDGAPREFIPHVTVARDGRESWPPAPDPAGEVAWEVHEWVLVRSETGRAHAYEFMHRQALGTS